MRHSHYFNVHNVERKKRHVKSFSLLTSLRKKNKRNVTMLSSEYKNVKKFIIVHMEKKIRSKNYIVHMKKG